jgi:ubiquinone/menaquinone biosynthesis C-methylase UbiE
MRTIMPLTRVLEPEEMDTDEEAREYDAMDHRAVNVAFAEELLALRPRLGRTLDDGTGTAQIPVELARRAPAARIVAIDLADWMLRLARRNVEHSALSGVIALERADAKRLRFEEGSFDCVMSNSLIHHVPDPRVALSEMRRVLAPGGLLFLRDLARPATDSDVSALVDRYARGASERQRALFDASLRAALTVEEMASVAREVGMASARVTMSSDRHVTLVYEVE